MSNEAVEMLVRQARELQAEIDEKVAEKAAIVDRLKKEIQPGEKVVVDGVAASHRPGNRKYSLTLALKLLDDETKLKCVRPMIDEKFVRMTVEQMGLIDSAMEPAPADKTVFDLTK
jgi:hypothetical protein